MDGYVRMRALEQVPAQWHRAFLDLAEEGRIDPDFEAYLETDDRCQEALELIAAPESEDLRALFREERQRPAERNGRK